MLAQSYDFRMIIFIDEFKTLLQIPDKGFMNFYFRYVLFNRQAKPPRQHKRIGLSRNDFEEQKRQSIPFLFQHIKLRLAEKTCQFLRRRLKFAQLRL